MNIKKYTEELGIRPSKKLGQNFLLHENTAKKILDWANFPSKTNVLEIGPGLGALTFHLVERGHPLSLIEKDAKLFQFLKEKLPERVALHHDDVLDFTFSEIFPREEFYVISNAPYSISTPIVEKILTEIERIPQMVFLFQEEVVDRICAVPNTKEYGRLAIWIQSQCDIERGPRISKENFFPKPDVESRLVRIVKSKNPIVPASEREAFLKWISKIFQQRRKTFRKNLREMDYDPKKIETVFGEMNILETVRAETLPIQTLYKIFSDL